MFCYRGNCCIDNNTAHSRELAWLCYLYHYESWFCNYICELQDSSSILLNNERSSRNQNGKSEGRYVFTCWYQCDRKSSLRRTGSVDRSSIPSIRSDTRMCSPDFLGWHIRRVHCSCECTRGYTLALNDGWCSVRNHRDKHNDSGRRSHRCGSPFRKSARRNSRSVAWSRRGTRSDSVLCTCRWSMLGRRRVCNHRPRPSRNLCCKRKRRMRRTSRYPRTRSRRMQSRSFVHTRASCCCLMIVSETRSTTDGNPRCRCIHLARCMYRWCSRNRKPVGRYFVFAIFQRSNEIF